MSTARGELQFTAIYARLDSGWVVGYVEELPFVHAEGRTFEQAKDRLQGCLTATLVGNRLTTRVILDQLRLRYFCRDWIYPAI
jgi:predicted RNase H-like HicB family nuclease